MNASCNHKIIGVYATMELAEAAKVADINKGFAGDEEREAFDGYEILWDESKFNKQYFLVRLAA